MGCLLTVSEDYSVIILVWGQGIKQADVMLEKTWLRTAGRRGAALSKSLSPVLYSPAPQKTPHFLQKAMLHKPSETVLLTEDQAFKHMCLWEHSYSDHHSITLAQDQSLVPSILGWITTTSNSRSKGTYAAF